MGTEVFYFTTTDDLSQVKPWFRLGIYKELYRMGGVPTRTYHPGDAEPPFELKGWKIRFNTYTVQGRHNCANASLAFWVGVFGSVYLYNKCKKNSAAAAALKED